MTPDIVQQKRSNNKYLNFKILYKFFYNLIIRDEDLNTELIC